MDTSLKIGTSLTYQELVFITITVKRIFNYTKLRVVSVITNPRNYA